jgi:Holliday junction resolvase RusA-like endonuclease
VTETILRLDVIGQPQRTERVRFVRATGQAYTPAKTRAAVEALAGHIAMAVTRDPVDFEVGLSAEFVMGPSRGKPDIDNLAKMVLDACTRANVWTDDVKVADLRCLRRRSRGDSDPPRTVIEVWRL